MNAIAEGVILGISVEFINNVVREMKMVKRIVAGMKVMGMAVRLMAAKIKNTTVAGVSMVDPLLTVGIHGIALDGVSKTLTVLGMGAVTASMFIMSPFYLNLATWGAFSCFFVAFFRGMRVSFQQMGRQIASV